MKPPDEDLGMFGEDRAPANRYFYEKIITRFPRLVEGKLTRTHWSIFDSKTGAHMRVNGESATAHKLKHQHETW